MALRASRDDTAKSASAAAATPRTWLLLQASIWVISSATGPSWLTNVATPSSSSATEPMVAAAANLGARELVALHDDDVVAALVCQVRHGAANLLQRAARVLQAKQRNQRTQRCRIYQRLALHGAVAAQAGNQVRCHNAAIPAATID